MCCCEGLSAGTGVKPEAGIFTAIIAGFLISALGGSTVQIGGPAGAFIVIVYGIVQQYGLANLLISTILAGVLLFAMGLLKLGALVRYVPVPIIIGFTNGIAVLLALSQVKDLLGLRIDKMPSDFFEQIHALATHLHTIAPAAPLIGAGCLALVVLWPKSYTMPEAPAGTWGRLRRLAAHLPGTVIALVLATAATALLNLPVETIGSRFGGIPQGLPAFALPEFSWVTVKQLIFPTLTIALLCAIESLLCARVADNATDYPRHDPNQELMAQGVANVVAPFFGGIPATGTIARTITNVRAGGASPVAGIVLFVAWNMGEWHEFARLSRFSAQYRTILLGTFVLTVVFDLTVAVEVGLVLACVFFIWRMGQLFEVRPHGTDDVPAGVFVFELFGSLFFGAVGKIDALPAQLPEGTRAVVLEMHRLISIDTSGLEALQQLYRVLERRGVGLVLANVNEQPLSLMRRSGFEAIIGADAIVPNLGEAVEQFG